MNTKNLLLVVFLIISKLVISQTYIPFPNDSATWVVSKSCSSPCNIQTGTQAPQLVQSGDSIKNGILYHKLYSVASPTTYGFYCFYRENAKRIYLKYPLGSCYGNDTSEFVLYDFNLNIGDTFTIKTPTGTCYTSFTNVPKMRLNSKTTTTVSYVNGPRTAYSFSSVTSGFPSMGLNITWYEGLGTNKGFLYNLSFHSWPILTPSSYPYTYYLTCFYRSNTLVYNPGCLVTNLSDIQAENLGFVLFPNPSGDKVSIQNKTGLLIKEIYIFNKLNQVILSGQHFSGPNEVIDVSCLAEGVYFVKIVFENKEVLFKKIIKN
ncbi:MAG: T9SS type A sorting domain-containing protein [Bacteroidetes bacterium]|nr:T9SS type A sorting domain-containing protein [Bacteroidota bacterium]